MRNAFDKLGPAETGRIAELKAAGEYFWLDLTVERPDPETLGPVAKTLGIPDAALTALGDFEPRRGVPRKFHADANQVVFPFTCIRQPDAAVEAAAEAMEPLEVHVLVHGDYVLTIHPEPCGPLDLLRGGELPAGRSEQYLVYLILDTMTDTVFEALAGVEHEMERLEDELAGASERTDRPRRRAVIIGARARLTNLRRRIGPQRALFERVSEEIQEVRGLERGDIAYLERIDRQLNQLVDGIDAANQSLSGLLDLGLNQTIYRLTVIATIFLPLTFVTGFFGMNFEWMVNAVDTLAAFLILGLGSLVIATALIWLVISREVSLPWDTARGSRSTRRD